MKPFCDSPFFHCAAHFESTSAENFLDFQNFGDKNQGRFSALLLCRSL